jgi:hypothetical protein
VDPASSGGFPGLLHATSLKPEIAGKPDEPADMVGELGTYHHLLSGNNGITARKNSSLETKTAEHRRQHLKQYFLRHNTSNFDAW